MKLTWVDLARRLVSPEDVASWFDTKAGEEIGYCDPVAVLEVSSDGGVWEFVAKMALPKKRYVRVNVEERRSKND